MYKTFVKPFLDKLDHESSLTKTKSVLHAIESNPITLKIFEWGIHKNNRFTHKKLHVSLNELFFDNPLILAAGWDKNGVAVKAMHRLGFGGIEVGSVLAYPQDGNPRPRLHVIGRGVVLNHMGFNAPGMEKVAQNLERYIDSKIPIGINIGKNKYIPDVGAPALYAVVARRLYEYASYFVINVSSPNTVGLKNLQEKEFLSNIIAEVNAMMSDIGVKKPLFVKIAPDISQETLKDVIDTVLQHKLSGIIAINTFPHANSIAKYGQQWEGRQGGLSGNDTHYRDIGTKLIASIYNQTNGKVTIIGVGGVMNAEHVLEKIRAGASLVQIFSGLYAQGPTIVNKINRKLVAYMEENKISNIQKMVGVDAKMYL